MTSIIEHNPTLEDPLQYEITFLTPEGDWLWIVTSPMTLSEACQEGLSGEKNNPGWKLIRLEKKFHKIPI